MMLYRLAWPTRLKDMIQIFGCSRSAISKTVNRLVYFLYQRYHAQRFWDAQRLTLAKLQEYEHAISTSCKGINKIWGFIDGTVRPIARPEVDQERFYSGHKGYHGIRFQAIVTPDGLISSLYGPEYGPVGDWRMWKDCGIAAKLRELFTGTSESDMLYLYGDPAYSLSYGTLAPFSRRELSARENAMNIEMSSARIVVEWGFGLVRSQFSYGEKKSSQQTGLSAIGAYYIVAVLLTNCQTCLRRRNQISERFNNLIRPPTLAEYLHDC